MFVQWHGLVDAECVAVKADRASVVLQNISRQIAHSERESLLVEFHDERLRAEAEMVSAGFHCDRNGASARAWQDGPGCIFGQGLGSRNGDAQYVIAQSDDPFAEISGLHIHSIGQRVNRHMVSNELRTRRRRVRLSKTEGRCAEEQEESSEQKDRKTAVQAHDDS
jgi:hypothetical protein